MTGRRRFRRRGPLLELAPGCWINVAGVAAILPADGGDGLTVVEADGRSYVVRSVQAVMAQAVADALLDWVRDRAQTGEEGRWLALDSAGGADPVGARPPGAGDADDPRPA